MANILIVEDQPHLRELFSLELKDEGHKICNVMDAESVNGYLMNSKPDLVLLDLDLNGFEGWGVLHGIKSAYPDLPVLLVTVYDYHAQAPCLSQAHGYIRKNLDAMARLKKKIADLLSCEDQGAVHAGTPMRRKRPHGYRNAGLRGGNPHALSRRRSLRKETK